MISHTETHAPSDAGVGELVARLATEAGALVRQEAALAALEFGEKIRAAAAQTWVIGTGLLVVLVGAQTLVCALVLWLGLMMLPLWMAAALVGGVLTLMGAITVGIARTKLAQISLAPLKTIQTLKEGRTWAQQLIQ